jgi:D-sedoheptulose 7-phosphate isomerase
MMNFTRLITKDIKESYRTKKKILENIDLIATLENISNVMVKALQNGNKIMFAGNGGSAADAQHIAAELVGRFEIERGGLPAIALTTDTSILTAVGNDYSFDTIFERQIEALGQKGDVFVGFSTSGNSENIIRATKKAQSKGVITVALTGETGGKLLDISDFIFRVPSKRTARIQESHIMVGHILCSIIDEVMFNKEEISETIVEIQEEIRKENQKIK